ncbi:MAG TPA: hypothetical protein VGP25_13470, partial [Gemmatimonadaceae bacterium]|nr:hypothetical protein [Gemmatimonadaceae bacterium]
MSAHRFRYISRTSYVLGVLASLVCQSMNATAQLAAQPIVQSPTAPDDSIPVVLTIQGGGSLGVYEAGMAWMLVELFKRDGALPREQRHFTKLYLASATGAS